MRLFSNLSNCILERSHGTGQFGVLRDLNLTVFPNVVFFSAEQWHFNSVTAPGLTPWRAQVFIVQCLHHIKLSNPEIHTVIIQRGIDIVPSVCPKFTG